ncbi:MAG: hypothetical protein R3335_05075 [Anaerolineales bacterium]|nr:hypothetical protein [Anaerolineales bacterium]
MKKRRRWFAYLLLFGISLAVGGWLGFKFGEFGKAPPATEFPISTEAPRPDQRSLLIVGVDRVDSMEARLQGVWYVVYRQNLPRITLIPLYPALPGSDSSRQSRLEDGFRMRSDGVVDPAFFRLARDSFSISWDGHVLLDEIAMIEIVDFFGGIEINGERISGPLAVGAIPQAKDRSPDAVLQQAFLLEALCQDITFESAPKTYEKILSLIPDHLQTELTRDEAFNDWLGLLSSGDPLLCEFPSLRPTPTP